MPNTPDFHAAMDRAISLAKSHLETHNVYQLIYFWTDENGCVYHTDAHGGLYVT